MFVTLAKPHLLTIKNTLWRRGGRIVPNSSPFRKQFGLTILSALMLGAIYSFVSAFLHRLQGHDELSAFLAYRFLHISLAGIFLLLALSSFISVVGQFFAARDLTLLLALPIPRPQLYLYRFGDVVCRSAWSVFFVALPCIFAYATTLPVGASFVLAAIGVLVALSIIAAGLGSVIGVVFACIVPAQRTKELLLLVATIVALILFLDDTTVPTRLSPETYSFEKALFFFSAFTTPLPAWLPATWAAHLLEHYFFPDRQFDTLSLVLLLTAAGGLFSLGMLLFDLLFQRGLSLLGSTRRQRSQIHLPTFARVRRILSPFTAQFRAISQKEFRMFFRDASQSVQLILLLLLTFVYLYNFRTLQSVSSFRTTTQEWWRSLLCLSNIALGGCIVSAIATRLVFPSVSLEGQSYALLRAAPLSLRQLLWAKFWVWISPVSLIAATLIVSGAWAVEVPPLTAIFCGALSIALSIGIVGLAVGVGAVYARFDWDTPTEIGASFGSLVYMFLSLAVLLATIIPAALLVVLTSVPALGNELSSMNLSIIFAAGVILCFAINISVTCRSITAGEQSLQALER